MFYLEIPEKNETGELVFMFGTKYDAIISNVSCGLKFSEIRVYPLDFPEHEWLVSLGKPTQNNGEFHVEILLSDSSVIRIFFLLENGIMKFRDFTYCENVPEKIEDSVMNERKKIAAELFSSDEAFVEELTEIYGDPSAILIQGEKAAEKIASGTIYISDEDKALQYINWKVSAAPDSLQNQLLSGN